MLNWNKKFNVKSILSILCLQMFLGCSTTQSQEITTYQTIYSEESVVKIDVAEGWRLQQMINPENKLVDLLPGTRISLLFAKQSKLSGNSGCNTYFAAWKASGEHISISRPGATMIACPGPVMQQEQYYFMQLDKIKTFKISAERLFLYDADGIKTLQFSMVKPVSLVGGNWQLKSFNNGNALLSNLTTETINVVFSSDGHVSGFAGCNRYTGAYQAEAEQLKLSPLAMTRKMCHKPEHVMKTESAYIEALNTTHHYTIRYTILTLYNTGGQRVAIYEIGQ